MPASQGQKYTVSKPQEPLLYSPAWGPLVETAPLQ
jgi:hypothetical protein